MEVFATLLMSVSLTHMETLVRVWTALATASGQVHDAQAPWKPWKPIGTERICCAKMLRVSNRGISRSWMKGTLVVDTFHTIIFLKSWIYYINLYHCFNIFANISSRSTEHFTSRIPALEVTTKDCLWHHRAGAPGVQCSLHFCTLGTGCFGLQGVWRCPFRHGATPSHDPF